MADVLGFATKATKSTPKAVAYSKGTQSNIDAIKANAGPLSSVIGQGPDASYKAFQTKQRSLASQITQTKQQTEQVRQQAEDTAKAKTSLLGHVKNVAETTGKGYVNVSKMGAKFAKDIVVSTAKAGLRTGEAVSQGIGNAELKIGGRKTENAQQYEEGLPQSFNKFTGYKGTKKQITGDVIQTGALALPGAGKVVEGGAKVVSKVAPKTVASLSEKAAGKTGAGMALRAAKSAVNQAPVGATFGAGQALSNDQNVAKGAALGALTVGAAGAGGSLIKSGLRNLVKPDLTAEKAAVASQAGQKAAGRMQLGQTAVSEAVKPLEDEKAKLQQLKIQHPGQPKVDEAIANVDKKMQDVQKTTVKEAEQSQKISDKNTAEAKKIDKQVELIKAKKADAGKLSNVDQVKLKQLADRRQELSASLPAPKHSGAMAETPPETVVHLPNKGIYAKASPDQIAHITDEVKNIPSDSADLVHLSPLNNATQRGATEVPLEDLLQKSPNATKAITSVPREGVKPVETKTSGVASSIEAKAVEKKLSTGFEGKAGYDPVTVKEQAAKATDLVKTDLEKAKRMANGDESVPSDLRGAALITALEEHATRTKDVQLLKDLASSPLVAETSRHAQELRLLAEREPSSAVAKIREVAETRRKAAESRIGKSMDKEVKRNARVVNSHLPAVKAKDWNDFISALKC